MKLTINSIELTKALEQAAKFVSHRPLMPILGNIKLVATDDKLALTGFDLAHGIEIDCIPEVIERGSVCIPVSAIAIVKGMQGQLIIESDDNHLITISNLSGKVEIQGQPADEYPELTDDDTDTEINHTIDAKFLSQAAKYCAQATSSDESKQILTGINIAASNGNLRAMATDGHRLAIYNMAVSEDVEIKAVTIPAKSLKLVPTTEADTILVSVGESKVSIDTGNRSIMRTLEGKYPDAMMLVPKAFNRQLTIDRKELIDGMNMMLAISDANNLVKFTIADAQTTISSKSDGKSGKVDIKSSLIGDSLEIAFNLKYLLDGLKMFDSKQIKISINGSLQPVIITPVDSEVDLTYLVMPVQIRE